MAQGYPQGQPCSVFREHIGLNVTSFSTVASTDSDFWRETANISGMPARGTHTVDSTAYGTQPTSDSWQMRLAGAGSVANSSATNQGGQLT